MINVDEVLEKLEAMIGTDFDEDEIIISFESEEEVIVNSIEGVTSNIGEHGLCQCYNAYENTKEGEIFTIYISDDDKIVYRA